MTKKLFVTVLIAIVLLSANMSIHAASVDPSVEITGVLAQPFCSSANGQLLSQIGNTTIPASFRMEFFAPGVGEVYNQLLNFSSSGNLNFTGFAVSPYSLAPNTPFTMRTTTYDAPGGAGNVTFISEIVFNCTSGAVISLKSGPPLTFNNTNPVTFFSPGDDRIDARPADRLGVHCVAPNIIHIVAADNSLAAGYVQFKLADLLAAGDAGLSKPLLSYVTNQPADGGIISVQATRSEGKTYFYVAWNGGKYHATGQGDFVKSFASPNASCAF